MHVYTLFVKVLSVNASDIYETAQSSSLSVIDLNSISSLLCSEYGFAEKVVEGMSVIINSITIKVQARAFHASFELWQLQGNSLNPEWQRSDLRYTRVTDPKRGEVEYSSPPPGLPGLC